jgi:hypothetical protein
MTAAVTNQLWQAAFLGQWLSFFAVGMSPSGKLVVFKNSKLLATCGFFHHRVIPAS